MQSFFKETNDFLSDNENFKFMGLNAFSLF